MKSAPAPLRFALFDLDQTLYPISSGLMAEVGQRINQYMKECCGFSDAEIAELRDGYFRQYGTTLRGLILHHGVDPDDYLAYVHNLPLERFIQPNPALDEVLAGCPLTKFIFTSASLAHAERVLGLLGVAKHFSIIIDVKSTGYINKPDPRAYQKALEIVNARAEECILLDDADRNLLPAKQMGMVTILVGSDGSEAADFAIPSIDLLAEVCEKLNSRMVGRV